jgi:hypothetical protein
MVNINLSTQHILIFETSIFEEGIVHLLTKAYGLQVSYTRYTNELAFLDEIVEYRPGMILLNESTRLNRAHIFKLLFSILSLAGLRIIVIRLGNNMIEMYALPKQVVERNAYERQQYNIARQDELVAVLQV